jgi:predicted alpha-1,2-mannosidase
MMMKKFRFPRLLVTALWFSLQACVATDLDDNVSSLAAHVKAEQNLAYVDPFIGTGGHGHTFPGAVVPFGMVQLSPDNLSKGWDWTSGYHYSDNQLLGFSHTHLSGTGVGDLLDVLVMPFHGDYAVRRDNEQKHLLSTYSHENEQASPGYYQVVLEEDEINAELTATERSGVHRYQFSKADDAKVLIDLGYAQNYDKSVVTFMRVINNTTLVGYRISTGWSKYQPIYFVAKFNQPFSYQFYQQGKKLQGQYINTEKSEVVLNFGNMSKASLQVNVGLSYVSIAGAQKNLAAEVGDKEFDAIRQQARDKWQQQLAKFTVTDSDEEAKTIFYTALYHSFLAPQIFNDVDGGYFAADGSAQKSTEFERYSLFSLWDTFRALHPLLTITNGPRVTQMVNSMLAFYDETGLLPSWDLMSNETDVMIGYHAVPVIVDAYFKGLTHADPQRLFEALKASAMQKRFGIDLFDQYGYVPSDLEVEAVSKTLEYAFDDWAIARMAKALNKTEDHLYYSKRAMAYKTLFDNSTGFMRGKDKQGQWVSNFSPTHVDHRKTDYTEANAWQYTWFVPHDVKGLINLYGSEQAFVEKLDTLFSTSSHMEGDVSPDISGLIGQYAHGNEPCHHIAYLYSYTKQKFKGEQRIRDIRKTMYRAEPDGLAGNDDVGQMSAWYVFSALGFYPLNPASGEYILGTPLFDSVNMQLPGGKNLLIIAKGDRSKDVASVRLNGEQLATQQLSHRQLMAGGVLEFEF